MKKRFLGRIALALVVPSAVAALLAPSGLAAPRRPSVSPNPVENVAPGKMNARRVEHHVRSTSAAAPRQPAVALSSLESDLLGDINALRAQHGLAPLHLSAQLTAASRAHTQEMARLGYFEHESADGTEFWKRIEAFYPQGNRSMWSVGENLLYAEPDIDAAGALQSWLESPPHRANLLSRNWRDIGVAAVHAVAAPGDYDGHDVTIMTTDFGVRH